MHICLGCIRWDPVRGHPWPLLCAVWSDDPSEGNKCIYEWDEARQEQLSEKDAKLAQKLDQLQPFIDVLPHECMSQLASFGFWANLTAFSL